MKKQYDKALVEVLEVIKYLPTKEKNLIPNDVLERMEEEKDKKYYFSLDRTQRFDIQISNTSKAILANLFKKYWATDYELKVIGAKEKKNRALLEKKKQKMYPTSKVFKK